MTSFMHKFTSDRLEHSKILLLFGYLFCVVSASTIGRTAADTLFLSRYDAAVLSYMYLPQAATLLFVGFIYQRICGLFRADQLVVGVICLVSLLTLGSRIFVGLDLGWIYPVIYIGYDVLNFLMIVCFWQFATVIMDQRKAKKMIGWVGSGGIVGGILSGFGLNLMVQPLGTANLIYVYAGLQLLCLLFVFYAVRRTKNSNEVFALIKSIKGKLAKDVKRTDEGKKGLFNNVPHLKYVAIMAGTLVISLTLIDYQFKVILRGTLQNEALAEFMGSFYGFAGLLALLIQFFVSGKLITRFGVMTAILVFPVALFTGSIALLLVPVLALAVAVKGSDKVLGDTIYSSVSQLIMFPISPEWRGRAKGFLDGIVRNGAKGIAAICIILLTQWFTVHQLSYFILGLMGLCILAAIKIKGTYLQMLLSTLQTRGMDLQAEELNMMDPASIKVLISALNSPQKHQALYALHILRGLQGFNMGPYIQVLLQHPVKEVRIETLKYIQLNIPAEGEQELRALTSSEDTQIQSNGILALAAYSKEENIELLIAYLDEVDVEVRTAAIAGLIKYYGIEGMFYAVGTLKLLIESTDEEERTAMASIFGLIGIAGFYKPLIPLLQDQSMNVRIRAVESASILAVPELVPHLVPLLQHNQTRYKAIEALAAYDERIILNLLEPYLLREDVNHHLPGVFEKMGTQQAFDILLHRYDRLSADLRDKVVESLNRMIHGPCQMDFRMGERLILQEIEFYWNYIEHSDTLGNRSDLIKISGAIEQYRLHLAKRIFQLLALIYETKTIHAVYMNWSEGDSRQQANAAEVIDQLLQGTLRTEITKLMSPFSTFRNGKSINPNRLEEDLLWFYEQGDSWINHVIYQLTSGVNQDTWSGIRNQINLSKSPSEQSRIAEQTERVLVLKKVSFFTGLSGKDLLNVARDFEVESFAVGMEIVREMEAGDSLYIITKGKAGLFRNSMKIGEMGTNDCFGEMAVLTRSLSTATVIAQEELQLLRLDSEVFYEIIFDRTEIALEIMKLLSRRIRNVNDKIVEQGMLIQQGIDALFTGDTTQMFQELAVSIHSDQGMEPPSQEEEPLRNEILIRRILVLQKISLFAHLSQVDFIRLAQMVEEGIYAAGENICRMGEDGDTMFGIIEGSIRVHKGSEPLAKLGEGDCFGEMAIIDGDPRSADCTAVERTILLKLTREQVLSFCFQHIHVLKSMMRVLAERLKEAQQRV